MCSAHRQSFHFYDVELRLSGDVGAVLTCLHRSYRSFQVVAAAESVRRLDVTIFSDAKDDGTFSIHLDNGVVWRLPPLRPAELAELLVRYALAQVCSHFLLHAGALSWQEQGILLAGDSGAGKTTLTLALQQQGFAFLSDETGAVEREGGRLHPFPRLPQRRGGVEAAGVQASSPEWMPPVGEAVALRHLFLLDHSMVGIAQERRVVVLCDRLNPALLPILESVAGLRGARATTCRGLPAFTYSSSFATLPFSPIERLCLAHGSTVLDVVESSAFADFTRPPRLQHLPRSQTALALLGHLQNGYRSRLFRTAHAGDPISFLAELVGLLRGVACYRLQPGGLQETVDLICAAVG